MKKPSGSETLKGLLTALVLWLGPGLVIGGFLGWKAHGWWGGGPVAVPTVVRPYEAPIAPAAEAAEEPQPQTVWKVAPPAALSALPDLPTGAQGSLTEVVQNYERFVGESVWVKGIAYSESQPPWVTLKAWDAGLEYPLTLLLESYRLHDRDSETLVWVKLELPEEEPQLVPVVHLGQPARELKGEPPRVQAFYWLCGSRLCTHEWQPEAEIASTLERLDQQKPGDGIPGATLWQVGAYPEEWSGKTAWVKVVLYHTGYAYRMFVVGWDPEVDIPTTFFVDNNDELLQQRDGTIAWIKLAVPQEGLQLGPTEWRGHKTYGLFGNEDPEVLEVVPWNPPQ